MLVSGCLTSQQHGRFVVVKSEMKIENTGSNTGYKYPDNGAHNAVLTVCLYLG